MLEDGCMYVVVRQLANSRLVLRGVYAHNTSAVTDKMFISLKIETMFPYVSISAWFHHVKTILPHQLQHMDVSDQKEV